MFTVGIYDQDYNLIRPLRLADTHDKANYLCEYYKARLNLPDNLSVMYM